MEPSTITIRTVIRLEKAGPGCLVLTIIMMQMAIRPARADLVCLALITAMIIMAIKQANQGQTCLAEETSMMLMETKQAIRCKDSLGITIITTMTDKNGRAEFSVSLFLHKQKQEEKK